MNAFMLVLLTVLMVAIQIKGLSTFETVEFEDAALLIGLFLPIEALFIGILFI